MFQKIRKTFQANIYLALCYRLFIIYLLYTLSRLVFYLYNADHFNNLSFGRLITIFSAGIQFDTTAIIYTNMLFLLGNVIPFKFRYNANYQSVLRWIFIICNGIALLTNFADIPYFDFVLERTTISIIDQFKHETNLWSLFFKFIFEYWIVSLSFVLSIWLMIFLYDRVKISASKIKNPFIYYPLGLVIMLAIITLSIGGIRGGFKHSTRPITLSNAGQYVKTPAEIGIVLNTPFCLIRSTESESFKRVEFFESEKELEEVYTPIHLPDTSSVKRYDNVVIFILESFNKEFIGSLHKELDNGNYKGYASFLDTLILQAKTYKYSYANGRRSIDALPSVLTSIPSIESPFILSPYFNNNLNSLPNLLKNKGYKSALFHGAPNGSMGFQAFGQLIGEDEYYGKTEYNNDKDFDGIWGIWDEEFLQYYAHTLDTFHTPFVATVFTVTSHHPFLVPPRYENKFRMNDFPLQRCISYTDYSIGQFFKTASKMKWYKNTLFILTADHVSLNQRPEFKNELGYFSVPIIFFKPGSDLVGIDTVTVAQQIDIMPTVLSYLGYDKPYVAFGQDLFHADSTKFAVNHLNGTYRIYKGDFMLQFDGKKSVHMYNVKKDPLLKTDIIDKDKEQREKLEVLAKAFIQQFKNRMIDNKITVN